MEQFTEILTILGFVLRALGFAVLGFGVGRFIMDAYKKAVWQVQIALAVSFLFLLAWLTHLSTPGSMGMFALGAGVALILAGMAKKEEKEEEKK